MATEEAIPNKGFNQTWKRNKDVNHPVSLNRKTLAKVKRKEKLLTRYLKPMDGPVYTQYCRIRN